MSTSDDPFVEAQKLTDLLADSAIEDLTRALVALASVCQDTEAILASLCATSVLMHHNLLQLYLHNQEAAKENQALFVEMLERQAKEIGARDLASLSAMMALPVIRGPRRVQ